MERKRKGGEKRFAEGKGKHKNVSFYFCDMRPGEWAKVERQRATRAIKKKKDGTTKSYAEDGKEGRERRGTKGDDTGADRAGPIHACLAQT